MISPKPNIQIPVDLTNPGQFFACCGLLELADRESQETIGWFDGEHFCMNTNALSFTDLLSSMKRLTVANTMSAAQTARLDELSELPKKQLTTEKEAEKKRFESLRREAPIVLSGAIPLRIDWFRDSFAGGSRFKTWAGQQSVLDIAKAMHAGIEKTGIDREETLFASNRGLGLPFNFDSDLGGQGSALDIGFSFDPLASSEATRIASSCRPSLEFLCFVGLQRFRPREVRGQNRFIYSAWTTPLATSVASAVVSQSIADENALRLEFRLLYRTKYLKSFLPAKPYQGDSNDHD